MPPTRRAATNSVERRVHFYRADTGTDANGQTPALDLSALGKLDGLRFAPVEEGGRYLELTDGEDLCAWVDSLKPPQQVRFAKLRRNALPQAESGGTLTAIQLAADAALYEAIHMVFFPRNIIGAEFNIYGPRPSRLPDYLDRVAGPLADRFVLEQILRGDVMQQLQQQTGLRLVEFRVRRSYAESMQAADQSLAAALNAAARIGQSDIVGVTLQADPHRHDQRLPQRVLSQVRSLARRSDLRENASVFKVKGVGPHGTVEPIDILSDSLVMSKKITRLGPRSRAVDPDSAYAAIREAYQEALDGGLLDGAGASAN